MAASHVRTHRSRRPRSRWPATALTALLALAAACSGGTPDGATGPSGPGEGITAGPDVRLAATLQPFDSCDAVLRWFQDEAVNHLGPTGDGSGQNGVWPDMFAGSGGSRRTIAREDSFDTTAAGPAIPQASAAPPSPAGDTAAATPEFSTTNVQETGADEPDIVKTDGRRLLSVADNQLRVIDVTGPSPKLTGTVTVSPSGPGDSKILLRGDRVLAITAERTTRMMPAVPTRSIAPNEDVFDRSVVSPPVTRLTLIDIANPAAPVVTGSVVIDGEHVDARLIDGRVRLVTLSTPQSLPLVHATGYSPESREVARKANEQVIRDSKIENWLPRVRPGDAPADDPGRQLVPCEQLRHPKEFSGLDTLTVATLDLGRDSLDLTDTTGLTAGGELAYASDRSLYVATIAIPAPPTPQPAEGTTVPGSTPGTTPPGSAPAPVTTPGRSAPPAIWEPPPPANTAVHAFSLTEPGPARYRASGLVEGTVRDRWSLSEHDGHLRAVSTTGPLACRGCPGQQSQVSVLAEQGGELKVVGTAGDMGKGEMVKSVRFIGARGYVVTFRQIDPLYVLDLADPTRPRVVGELKVPGYSAYLHPVGDGLLLGVGQDATDRGMALGTKVALYDVSDPASPRELDTHVVPGSTSEVERDSRAFLYWAPTRVALVPVSQWDGRGATGGTIGLRVGDTEVTEVGRADLEVHTPRTGQRSVVVGDVIHTVTGGGIRTSSRDSLADRGWLHL